jgi:hypothetical protein
MAGFQFRLQRVLEWRRTTLSLEQARLQNLRAQLRAIESARQELIDKRLAMQRDTAAAPAITGDDLTRLDRFRRWAEREDKALAKRAVDVDREIAAQSAKVMSADRDVRLVERLKERRREAWKAEQEKQIDETAGESAVAQWRRKSAAGGR